MTNTYFSTTHISKLFGCNFEEFLAKPGNRQTMEILAIIRRFGIGRKAMAKDFAVPVNDFEQKVWLRLHLDQNPEATKRQTVQQAEAYRNFRASAQTGAIYTVEPDKEKACATQALDVEKSQKLSNQSNAIEPFIWNQMADWTNKSRCTYLKKVLAYFKSAGVKYGEIEHAMRMSHAFLAQASGSNKRDNCYKHIATKTLSGREKAKRLAEWDVFRMQMDDLWEAEAADFKAISGAEFRLLSKAAKKRYLFRLRGLTYYSVERIAEVWGFGADFVSGDCLAVPMHVPPTDARTQSSLYLWWEKNATAWEEGVRALQPKCVDVLDGDDLEDEIPTEPEAEAEVDAPVEPEAEATAEAKEPPATDSVEQLPDQALESDEPPFAEFVLQQDKLYAQLLRAFDQERTLYSVLEATQEDMLVLSRAQFLQIEPHLSTCTRELLGDDTVRVRISASDLVPETQQELAQRFAQKLLENFSMAKCFALCELLSDE